MKRVRFALASICAAALLAACGGGGDGNQAPSVQYSKMVVFGDSLSDVGTYGTAGMVAITTAAGSTKAGKYTVNASDGSGLNWTEVLSDQLKLTRPCPASTGLNSTSDATLVGTLKAGIIAAGGADPAASVQASTLAGMLASMAAPATAHAGCYSYAQGGARVTNAVGPFNAALTASTTPATHVQGNLGQLTVPVTTQIDRHLASGGGFNGSELVIVAAGANDMFMNLGAVPANVATNMGNGMTLAAATQAAGITAIGSMSQAATELVGYIKTKVLANGAKRVVVLNIPDASISPYIVGLEATTPGTQSLVLQMVTAFNNTLAAGLNGVDGILFVDAFTSSQQQHANPAAYGLSDVTHSACNTNVSTTNVAFSSLMCNEFNLNTSVGATKDNFNTFLFADGNHPTPYGYKLMAQLVVGKMAARGWY